jgi:acetyl-CoA synthetase
MDEKHHHDENEVHQPPTAVSAHAHIKSMEQYKALYDESINNPEAFWDQRAKDFVTFFTPYTQVKSGTLLEGNFAWFLNGTINACYNAVDRHLPKRKDQVAILWEGDEPGTVRRITYGELFIQVSQWANFIKSLGVQKGDSVCIYLPMIPEAAIAMLACARIGASHSVVFAGFSTDSLRDRIQDGNSKIVITADEGKRGKKIIRLKDIVDGAVVDCKSITVSSCRA